MRSPSEDLFMLIKAMNKGEKRNFKLLAGLLTGEKKYRDLFSQIEKQNCYDESKILKKGIYGGQLSVAKNYLYRFLMRSLAYQSNDADSDLAFLQTQVKILMKKGLFSQAAKALRKAFVLALQLERFVILHHLYDLKMELLRRFPLSGKSGTELEKIHKEKQHLLVKIKNLDEYKLLHSKVSLLPRRGHNHLSAKQPSIVGQITEHKLLKNEAMALSTSAKIEFLSIKRKIFSLNHQLEKAAELSNRLIAIYDGSHRIRKHNLYKYFLEVNNLCTYYFRTQKYKQTFELIESFRSFSVDSPQAKVEFFQLKYVMNLAFAVHVGDPEIGLKLVPEIRNSLLKIQDKLSVSQKYWLFYLLSYLHWMAGKPDLALSWINEFLKEPKTELRIDLQAMARLLRLLIFFDLEEYIMLENELVNTQRYLEKSSRMGPYETGLVKTLRFLLKELGKGSLKNLMHDARDLYQQEMKASSEPHDILNFGIWMQAITDGTAMAELRSQEAGYSKEKAS